MKTREWTKRKKNRVPPVALFSWTDDTQLHTVLHVSTTNTGLQNNESKIHVFLFIQRAYTSSPYSCVYIRAYVFWGILFSTLVDHHQSDKYGVLAFTHTHTHTVVTQWTQFFFLLEIPLHQMKNIGALYASIVIVCTCMICQWVVCFFFFKSSLSKALDLVFFCNIIFRKTAKRNKKSVDVTISNA